MISNTRYFFFISKLILCQSLYSHFKIIGKYPELLMNNPLVTIKNVNSRIKIAHLVYDITCTCINCIALVHFALISRPRVMELKSWSLKVAEKRFALADQKYYAQSWTFVRILTNFRTSKENIYWNLSICIWMLSQIRWLFGQFVRDFAFFFLGYPHSIFAFSVRFPLHFSSLSTHTHTWYFRTNQVYYMRSFRSVGGSLLGVALRRRGGP